MTDPSLIPFVVALAAELQSGTSARQRPRKIEFDPRDAPAAVADLIRIVAHQAVDLDFGAHAVWPDAPLMDLGPHTWVLAVDFEEEPWLVLDWSSTLRIRVFEDGLGQLDFVDWAPLIDLLRERNGHDVPLVCRVIERLAPGTSKPAEVKPTGDPQWFGSPEIIHAHRARAQAAAARGELAIAPAETVDGLARPDGLRSPDGQRTLVLHPVRTRIVDQDGETVVLEGPWQGFAAWLDETHVVIGTIGGRHVLDRRDPEVDALPMLADLPKVMRQVPIQVPGHLHVVSDTGALIESVDVVVDRLATVPAEGLVVTSTKWPPRTRVYRWSGRLEEVAVFEVDIGDLGRVGSRWVGSQRFELFGVGLDP